MPYNTKNRYEQGQALRKEIYMYIVSYITHWVKSLYPCPVAIIIPPLPLIIRLMLILYCSNTFSDFSFTNIPSNPTRPTYHMHVFNKKCFAIQ